MGTAGKRILFWEGPGVDLKMAEQFGRKVGSPRGLDFEEMTAKLLSRRHHSFLWYKWGVGPSNEMLKQKSLQNHSKWSRLEMRFVLTFPGGE